MTAGIDIKLLPNLPEKYVCVCSCGTLLAQNIKCTKTLFFYMPRVKLNTICTFPNLLWQLSTLLVILWPVSLLWFLLWGNIIIWKEKQYEGEGFQATRTSPPPLPKPCTPPYLQPYTPPRGQKKPPPPPPLQTLYTPWCQALYSTEGT